MKRILEFIKLNIHMMYREAKNAKEAGQDLIVIIDAQTQLPVIMQYNRISESPKDTLRIKTEFISSMENFVEITNYYTHKS